MGFTAMNNIVATADSFSREAWVKANQKNAT
jgi:hypothetical protein